MLDPKWDGSSIVSWDVTTPIIVERPVTAIGNVSFPLQVTLKRAAAINNILVVKPNGSGSTIQNLVFNGNKAEFAGNQFFVDLDVEFGAWNNYIKNSDFHNAPNFAVNIGSYNYIQVCNFYSPKYVAVMTFNPGNNNTDIGIYSSYFSDAGTNAVFLGSGAKNSIVYDSTFYNNHNACLWGYNGGQIDLERGTSGIYLDRNTFDGAYAYCGPSYPKSSLGVEGYGTGHVVTGNTFKRHLAEGIYFNGAASIIIENNNIFNNYDGLAIYGSNGNVVPCSSQSANFTIRSNTIYSNNRYGVVVYQQNCANGPNSGTVSLSGNSIYSNLYNTPTFLNLP